MDDNTPLADSFAQPLYLGGLPPPPKPVVVLGGRPRGALSTAPLDTAQPLYLPTPPPKPAASSRGTLGAPPSPPNIEAKPPLETPTMLGERPQPNVPNPIQPPKPLTGWRKALAAIFAGMGAFRSPELGQRIYQEEFEQPQQEYRKQIEQQQQDIGQQREQASLESLRGAQSEEARARAEALENPTPKPVTDEWQPVAGTNLEVNRRTGDARPIQGMQEPEPKETPYNVLAQLHKEHPDWTPERIQEAAARASFPRVLPVTDAKGNTLGYNYFQGTPGGGVAVKFIPVGAGGAPTSGGVMPPKPTSTTLTMQQMAQSVLPEMKRVSDEIDQTAQQLGPAAGRWNEVMVGKVGKNNPQVAKLQTDLTLLASAIVRTHFGARGGQEYLKNMENYFRLAQSPDDLKARIASADEWLTNYSQMAGPPQGGQAAPTQTYNGYTYTQQPDGSWKRGAKAQ